MIGRFVAGLAAIALAGCSVVAPAPDLAGERRATADWTPPEAPATWRIDGRAAIRTPEDAGTVSVRWREGAEDYRIDLRGPLGSGAVRLTGDASGVLLRTGRGEEYRADSARALLAASAGYDLPVEYLRWWLRGQPVPDLGGTVITDDHGHAALLEQDGWRVTLSDYRRVGGYPLPRRVAASGGEVSARIAVGEWTLPP